MTNWRTYFVLLMLAFSDRSFADDTEEDISWRTKIGKQVGKCKENQKCFRIVTGLTTGAVLGPMTPAIVGAATGVGAVGPVAGGAFAATQAAAGAVGPFAAMVQSFVMTGGTGILAAKGAALFGSAAALWK